VLGNGGRAVGYVIGTASTPGFVAAYQQRWLPRLRGRYQPLSGPPMTEEEHRLEVMFHPDRWLLPELAAHPAHLHINLLAGYRGAGHGRELIDTFLASVAAAGAASCYLGVRPENANARRFYAKLGWRPVQVRGAEPGTYLVHRPASTYLAPHHRARQPRDRALAMPPAGARRATATTSPGATAHGRVPPSPISDSARKLGGRMRNASRSQRYAWHRPAPETCSGVA